MARSDADYGQVLVVEVAHHYLLILLHYLIVGLSEADVTTVHKHHAQASTLYLSKLFEVLFNHNIGDVVQRG